MSLLCSLMTLNSCLYTLLSLLLHIVPSTLLPFILIFYVSFLSHSQRTPKSRSNLKTYTWEVFGSNIGRDISYFSVPPSKYWCSISSRPRPLPSTSLPTYHLSISLSLDAIKSRYLQSYKNKPAPSFAYLYNPAFLFHIVVHSSSSPPSFLSLFLSP
jgi:hypothetical protein